MNMGLGGHGRWLAFLLFGLVAGVAITYFVLPRRAPATRIDESVCDRAFTASAGIHALLADRAALDPAAESHPLLGVAEEDRDEVWAAYVDATATYTARTIAEFNTTFAGESQFLVESLSAAGFWSEPTPVNAVNELAVLHLAQELDASALRAGCEK